MAVGRGGRPAGTPAHGRSAQTVVSVVLAVLVVLTVISAWL
jgi:hypothetical protein